MEETLGVFIFNYNGLQDIVQLLESIGQKVSGISYKLIIVDNASDNKEADYLEATYGDKLSFLRSSINCGYAAGNNIGLRYAIYNGINNLCVLNNDAIIADDFYRDCV